MTRITDLPELDVDALPLDAVTIISVAPAPGEDEQSYQFPIGQFSNSIAESETYHVSLAFALWSALNGVTGGTDGQTAAVFNDAGTHTDPVVGGTVANEGIYSWSVAEEGWERIANLESADAATAAASASAYAGQSASSAADSLSSANAAAASAAAAAGSEAAVAASASAASSSAGDAASSAAAALNSEEAAALSATQSSGFADDSAASASASAGSAAAASASAGEAADYANDSSGSASEAAASALAADADADDAAVSQAGAAASAASASTDRILAEAAAASAGTSANNALGTTTSDPRFKLWRLTATTNLALTGLSVVDGKQTVAGDRVFAPVQTNRAECGVYLVPASGAWSRTSDADTAADIANMYGYATDGIKNVGREFRLATTGLITLGTTALDFTANAYSESQDFKRRRGTCVIVGDSNRNGRIDYYTALPLELTGVGRPWEDWTVYNMAQNGSQLAGWIAAIATADPDQAPADYTGLTSPTNFWQVCNANPDVILFSLGINDRNSVDNRAGSPGQDFATNLNTAIMFLLQNSDATIILEVPQPYTGINFVAGAFTTGWDVDYATWGQASAEDNAAYWSARNRDDYLAWRGRNPRVLVHDTAEIFNPGVTLDPTLHRCDNPNLNCLDPDAARFRFVGSITSNVLTITALYSSGNIAVGHVVTGTAYGTGSGRTVTSLGTGTGGLGTYNLSAGPDVASSVMKVPASLIDDSLHFASTGARRILENFANQFGLLGRRKLSSFVGSEQGVDPYYTIFQSAYWSATFFYSGRSVSVGNALINIYPSPEAVILQGSPHDRRGTNRAAQYDLLSFAEHTILREDLARIKQLESLRGTIVKMMVIGGTGTIYTATAVALSSISTNTNFYHTVQFNGVDLAAEATSGRLVVWVEDPSALPFIQKQCSGVLPPGTAAVASIAIPNPSTHSTGWPIRRVKATRFASTDGAMSIDVGLSNQAGDNRLVDGSISTASLPYVIGTLTFSGTALDVTMTPNQTNIDAAIAAGIGWPAPGGSASGHARFKLNYRLMFVPSITITKPIQVFASE